MSTITTIQDTDIVSSSVSVLNTNFSNLNTDKIETLADLGITVTPEAINAPFSSGMIMMWPMNTTPTGWDLCRGQAISRTTYSDLFAVIGTTYGVGDGSTTFNIPNLQGRVPVGYDSTQTEFDALAETGGAKTHTLITGEMPAHTHGLYGTGTEGSAGSGAYLASDGSGGVTGSTGGGGAHNNLQPYMVINFIIKH